MDTITFADLAARFDNACRTPAKVRTREEPWQQWVLSQCKAIEPDFLNLNNRYARNRTPGFHDATSMWWALRRYAADHPEKFGDVADRLSCGDLSTAISIGGPRRMCEVLATMIVEEPRVGVVDHTAHSLVAVEQRKAEQEPEWIDSAKLEALTGMSRTTRKSRVREGLLGVRQGKLRGSHEYAWLHGEHRAMTPQEIIARFGPYGVHEGSRGSAKVKPA